MTDHRDRSADRPDPDADTWSAWLPPLDATADSASDTTADATQPAAPGPRLPQSAGPAVPPAPVSAQQSYPHTASPAVAVGPMPRSHMALAVISLFIGLPIVSIAAVIAAASVKSLWRRGRLSAAQRASRAALGLSIAALVLKVVWGIVQNNFMGMSG